jgi:inosine/xanthosine triphosphate pyrophosphatase family protein
MADCFDDTGLEVEALNGAPGYSLPDMQVNNAVLKTMDNYLKLI